MPLLVEQVQVQTFVRRLRPVGAGVRATGRRGGAGGLAEDAAVALEEGVPVVVVAEAKHEVAGVLEAARLQPVVLGDAGVVVGRPIDEDGHGVVVVEEVRLHAQVTDRPLGRARAAAGRARAPDPASGAPGPTA